MKCKVKNQCGGCRYIGTSYPETLNKKRKNIMRLFPNQHVDMVIGMEQPWHYRNKVYASFQKGRDGHLLAGMYEEGTHRVVSSNDCLIQNETANALIADFTRIADQMKLSAYHEDTGTGVLRHLYIRVSHTDGSVLLVIVTGTSTLPGSKKLLAELLKLHPEIKTVLVSQNHRRTSMVMGESEKILYGKGYIFDEIEGIRFRISSRSFFQVNPVQTQLLYQTAIDLANIKETDEVLDLCCGIGTITLLAARKAKHVTGIEIVPQAIKDAINNAVHNNIHNVSFYCSDIRKYLSASNIRPDVVVADPPRSGLGKEVSEAIGKSGVHRIVYVSCNPHTQVDDCSVLHSYGYQIERIIPVDMFPFTDHVETVCLLSKLSEAKNHISVKVDMDEMNLTVAESKATYDEIRDWVQEKYGFHVTHLNIAQVKRKHGIIERENYNKPKSEGSRQPGCPEEKEKAIEEALKYFQMIE